MSLIQRGGIYAKMRYPMVMAAWIYMLGVCLLTQSIWYWLALLFFTIYARIFLVQAEEDMLLNRKAISDRLEDVEDATREDMRLSMAEDYQKYSDRVKRWGVL